MRAWGIQTGPFAAHLAHFVLYDFQLFTFIMGGQFLLPQRTNNQKREKAPKLNEGPLYESETVGNFP